MSWRRFSSLFSFLSPFGFLSSEPLADNTEARSSWRLGPLLGQSAHPWRGRARLARRDLVPAEIKINRMPWTDHPLVQCDKFISSHKTSPQGRSMTHLEKKTKHASSCFGEGGPSVLSLGAGRLSTWYIVNHHGASVTTAVRLEKIDGESS